MGGRQKVLQARGLEKGACYLNANESLPENDPVPYIHVEGSHFYSSRSFLQLLMLWTRFIPGMDACGKGVSWIVPFEGHNFLQLPQTLAYPPLVGPRPSLPQPPCSLTSPM